MSGWRQEDPLTPPEGKEPRCPQSCFICKRWASWSDVFHRFGTCGARLKIFKMPGWCEVCGLRAYSKCPGCAVPCSGHTYYCGPGCQILNWPQHRRICRQIRREFEYRKELEQEQQKQQQEQWQQR